MLAFAPDRVRMEKAVDFTPRTVAMAEEFTHLSAIQPNGFGWMAQDINVAGAIGNAAAATSEKGEAAAAHGARAFVALAGEVCPLQPRSAPPGRLTGAETQRSGNLAWTSPIPSVPRQPQPPRAASSHSWNTVADARG